MCGNGSLHRGSVKNDELHFDTAKSLVCLMLHFSVFVVYASPLITSLLRSIRLPLCYLHVRRGKKREIRRRRRRSEPPVIALQVEWVKFRGCVW